MRLAELPHSDPKIHLPIAIQYTTFNLESDSISCCTYIAELRQALGLFRLNYRIVQSERVVEGSTSAPFDYCKGCMTKEDHHEIRSDAVLHTVDPNVLFHWHILRVFLEILVLNELTCSLHRFSFI